MEERYLEAYCAYCGDPIHLGEWWDSPLCQSCYEAQLDEWDRVDEERYVDDGYHEAMYAVWSNEEPEYGQ